MSIQKQNIIMTLNLWQIVGPLEESEIFNQNDFHLLESIAFEAAEKIKTKVHMLSIEEDSWVTLIIYVL